MLPTTTQNALSKDISLDQVKHLSGEARLSMPFVPQIEINNSQIDSKTNLPIPGFTLTTKKGDQYDKIMWTDTFVGTILYIRAKIEKTFVDKEPKESKYYSHEFDVTEGALVKVMDGNRNVIFTGTYPEVRKNFEIGKTQEGKSIVGYDYFTILYLVVNDTEYYRLKLKGDSRGAFFQYRKEFSAPDKTLLGVKTLFSTKINQEGRIKYSHLVLSTLEQHDWRPYAEKLLELRKALNVIENKDDKEEEQEIVPAPTPEKSMDPNPLTGLPGPRDIRFAGGVAAPSPTASPYQDPSSTVVDIGNGPVDTLDIPF